MSRKYLRTESNEFWKLKFYGSTPIYANPHNVAVVKSSQSFVKKRSDNVFKLVAIGDLVRIKSSVNPSVLFEVNKEILNFIHNNEPSEKCPVLEIWTKQKDHLGNDIYCKVWSLEVGIL